MPILSVPFQVVGPSPIAENSRIRSNPTFSLFFLIPFSVRANKRLPRRRVQSIVLINVVYSCLEVTGVLHSEHSLLELLIHISAFGVGGEECGVFLVGYVKVLIDLARLTKLQFQHAFLGSVADAGDTAGLYRNSLHSRIERLPGAFSPWMRSDAKEGTRLLV
jgi:hypothetical protein